MVRYLRRLADADLALDRSMIPLGSCTMKLNAAAEMEPVSYPGFADVHPFAPVEDTGGYRRLITDLETWLADVTGYDAVSLQPNAGSQGEFAGLLAIRAYHRSRGDDHRNVCLIPASAHGTNAASAAMVGMRVVVVACDDDGNVDVADLGAKLAEHAASVAALMVTYPSTHGVFEEAIGEVCAAVHDAGGQVYLDGANLNALVGVARPGRFGADVSHLNLHKTFCIPHGGGGPGVGPVAVRAHLAPYLPSHPVVPSAGPDRTDGDGLGPIVGPVSAAPFGSAGILPIPWAYISMMGPEGLRRATAVAILNANYIARRLGDAYPVLYAGAGGWVAHECILDLRPLTRDTGISVDDVAKRLIDYGFHAPTMSFPVAGTLDGGEHREREPHRARPVLRRHARHPGRDRRRRRRPLARRRQPAGQRPPSGGRRGHRHLGARLPPRPRGVARRHRPGQVLAAGQPHRRRLRRPQRGLLLPPGHRLRRHLTSSFGGSKVVVRAATFEPPKGESVPGGGRAVA